MKLNFNILAIWLLSAVLAFAFGWMASRHLDPYEIKEVRISRDTLKITIPGDTVELQSKPKIVYRDKIVIDSVTIRDTVIKTKPFVAKIDTVIKRDTIFAKYLFPENEFYLKYRKAPIVTEQITNTKTKTVQKKRAWWEVPAYVLSGVVGGYFVGKMDSD